MVAVDGLSCEQRLHDPDRFVEIGATASEVCSHCGELFGAVADSCLKGEGARVNRGESADVFRDEHGVPQWEEEEAADRAMRIPFRGQATKHGHTLVVGNRHRVVVAEAQRVESCIASDVGALDDSTRALGVVVDEMGGRK